MYDGLYRQPNACFIANDKSEAIKKLHLVHCSSSLYTAARKKGIVLSTAQIPLFETKTVSRDKSPQKVNVSIPG